MRKMFLFLICSVAFLACFSQTLDQKAIHRIGDYGKLWAILTLFHPEMAYNRVNADSLYIDNIGVLLSDPSRDNFRKSVQSMLDKLNDPYTFIEPEAPEDSVKLPERPLIKWLADSVALISFDRTFIYQVANETGDGSLKKIFDSLHHARAFIIDLRANNTIGTDYVNNPDFMKKLAGMFIDHPMAYPSYRTRIHYGHESQTFSSEFYTQGWVLQNSTILSPQPQPIHKPVCLIVNRYSNPEDEVIVALQNANEARVVADGPLPKFERANTYSLAMSDSLSVTIRLSEVLHADGSGSFIPDATIERNDISFGDTLYHVAMSFLKGNQLPLANSRDPIQNNFASAKVPSYSNPTYPSAPLRVLALMRYWSAIEYSCPNKDRLSKNWDSVLYEYVPQFLEAHDSVQYALTAARLITEIHDSHGFFGSKVNSALMESIPEVDIRWVQHKTIVMKVMNDSLKKIIGTCDEVVAVNGKPVRFVRDSIARYVGASNNASLQRDVSVRVLAGPAKTKLNLTLLHNGVQKTVRLTRNEPWYVYLFGSTNKGKPWKKISEKIGYVDFGRIEVSQIDSMFHEFENTDAIIIDDRSYPRGTVWTMVSYLSDKAVVGAIGTTMIADSPDPETATVQESKWSLQVEPKKLYRGKLIVLVNETTQSQAEYSVMVMQAASKNVTVIGSQTAGADGDVTGIALPGGIQTAFSGHGVHYPDGRPTQGIGIVPNIKIEPTVAGIKAGKDEVLERAILFAKTGW